MRFAKLLGLIGLLMLVLVGCGDDAPGETVTFAQNAASSDGAFVVGYPDGWTAQASATQILIANNADALNNISQPEILTAEQIAGSVTLLSSAEINRLFQFEDSPSPRDLLDEIVDRGSGNDQIRTRIEDRSTFRVGDNDAILASGKVENRNTNIEFGVILVLVQVNNDAIFFNFNTALDSVENFTDEIESIARAIQYPPESP